MATARENVPWGQIHGPGTIQLPEDVREASAALGASVPRVEPPVAITQAKAVPVDPELIKFLVRGLTSDNAQVQRYVIDNYTTPDVELITLINSSVGRDMYYHIYRTTVSNFNYDIEFKDIIIDNNPEPYNNKAVTAKVALWLDLKIRPAMVPFFGRLPVPCMILLYFSADPTTGMPKCCLQVDHHSFFIRSWYGGVLGQQLQEGFLRPLMGAGITTTGIILEKIRGQRKGLYTLEKVQPLPVNGGGDDAAVRQIVQSITAAKARETHQGGWGTGGIIRTVIAFPAALFGIWLMFVTVALEMTAPAVFGFLRALGM